MATRIYKTPFAATGDKEALATTDQPDGKVSLQAGWTPDYELPNDDPNYRPVGRQEMNGILNELTDGLGEVQLNGFAKWQVIDGGWPVGAWVTHSSVVYRSTTDANISEPGVGSAWVPIPAGIASAAQAQAWSDNTLALTSLRLADAFKGANQSTAANGFQKLPGGFILQWGTNAVPSGAVAITLPIAYPNAHLITVVSEGSAGSWGPANLGVYGTYGRSLTNFVVNLVTWNGTAFVAGLSGNICWYSIGR